ncbi:MAG TPA: carboxypeptidase-like regulatory domain-containing protein [Flavobacterium sp.]|nr:carboxypeptidase-like regulatory domain-containing protein [Flavobacterium sp.]
MKIFFFLLIVFLGARAIGQTGKIIDATTGESIPYANIQFNETQSLISNTEGFFSLSETDNGDNAVLVISYLGYATSQLTVGELKAGQLTVKLQPSVYELDEVHVSKLPSANAIMAEVKKNLIRNYGAKGLITENSVFMRESNSFVGKQLNVEIDESTGFSKDALKSVNKELAAFTSRLISHPPKEYTDMLCNYYKAPHKTAAPYKLNVVKATKLTDESRSASLEGLQKSATNLLLKHLDTIKYYRIKSGWFGSRDTVSLRKDFNKKKNQKLKNENESAKTKLTNFSAENSLLSTSFDFIHDTDSYDYKYEGTVYLNDGNFAYVLTFAPDRSKAKYTGKLYISQVDFGVLRADYSLAEGKKLDGFNMKLLLGVKVSENFRKGTIIYKQSPSGEGYYLQYALREEGQYIYLNRPLKFIELSESEKDVVAFDLKVEGNILEKTEYLNLSRNEITEGEYDHVTENNFQYLRIKQYDPKIWKGYSAIEPLEEMKRYKVTDEMP